MTLSTSYELNAGPDVTVVVVNYNTRDLLTQMLSALDAGRGKLKLQVLVVDNASGDGSAAIIRSQYPDLELIENRTNVGFGRANNQALPLVRGRYVLLLNTDAFVSLDTLPKTVEFMDANPRCGVLGVKLVGQDGALQPSCRYRPTPWNVFLTATGFDRFFPGARLVDDMSWDHASVRECDWVPGCFYLTRREVIARVGLFDPRYFLYYEEVDHCCAVRAAGWSVVYFPFTQVVHLGGASAESAGPLTEGGRQVFALQVESELLYFRKHYGLSGALSAVCLALLSDVYNASKDLVRRKYGGRPVTALRHARTVLQLWADTRGGRRAVH